MPYNIQEILAGLSKSQESAAQDLQILTGAQERAYDIFERKSSVNQRALEDLIKEAGKPQQSFSGAILEPAAAALAYVLDKQSGDVGVRKQAGGKLRQNVSLFREAQERREAKRRQRLSDQMKLIGVKQDEAETGLRTSVGKARAKAGGIATGVDMAKQEAETDIKKVEAKNIADLGDARRMYAEFISGGGSPWEFKQKYPLQADMLTREDKMEFVDPEVARLNEEKEIGKDINILRLAAYIWDDGMGADSWEDAIQQAEKIKEDYVEGQMTKRYSRFLPKQGLDISQFLDQSMKNAQTYSFSNLNPADFMPAQDKDVAKRLMDMVGNLTEKGGGATPFTTMHPARTGAFSFSGAKR